MKKTIITVTALVLSLLILLSLILSINLEFNLKVRRKISDIFRTHEIVMVESKVAILTKDDLVEDPNSEALLLEKDQTGDTYLDISFLSTGAVTASFDEQLNALTIVGNGTHMKIHADGNVEIEGEPIESNIAIKTFGDARYINLTQLNQTAEGRAFLFMDRPYTQGGNLIIENKANAYLQAQMTSETNVFGTVEALNAFAQSQFEMRFLYEIKNIFSKIEIVESMPAGNPRVYMQEEGVLKVVTEQQNIGYIELREDMNIVTIAPEVAANYTEANARYTSPIVLTWEAVYSYNPDTTLIPEMNHLNVISPTWYELSDAAGAVSSMASHDYVAWAQGRNYEVWALVSNAFDLDRTHGFLTSSTARERFIETMINEAKLYGYEGINIDFENVYMADKDALTHFVNEFAHYARKNQITLSMDVTVMGGSDNWSKCYDHEKLGQIVDFLIVMTYDEHWASSPISGPVASYDWMLHHMSILANYVDTDKLVLGVPLYTRVWREYPSETVANNHKTTSAAIGMEAQNVLIEKYNLDLIWDDTERLYYATFFEEDAQVKIWVENAKTIREKLSIVNDLGLKGAAAWRRGYETIDVWDAFEVIERREP